MSKIICVDNNPQYKVTVDSKTAFKSRQGHLRVDAIVTRVGVLPYWDAAEQKIIHVLRHPDQVFHPLSLDSIGGMPITLDHPIDNGRPVLVTPENFQRYGKGVVGDKVSVVNPYVKVEGLNIQSIDALQALKKGNKQLSPGYEINRVAEDGTFDGIKYSYRQYGIPVDGFDEEFIPYNHLAVMGVGSHGRSGPNIKVLMDSCLLEVDSEYLDSAKTKIFDYGSLLSKLTNDTNTTKRKDMSSILRLQLDSEGKQEKFVTVDDGGMVQVSSTDLQTLMSTLQQLVQQVTSLNQAQSGQQQQSQQQLAPTGLDSLENLAKAYLTVKGEKDALKVELDKAVSESKMALDSDVLKAKIKLIEDVKPFVKKDEVDSLTGMSDRELKVAVLKTWDSKREYGETVADATIDGMYIVALDSLQKMGQKNQRVKQQLNTDSGDNDVVTTSIDEMTNDEMKDKMKSNLSNSRKPSWMTKSKTKTA